MSDTLGDLQKIRRPTVDVLALLLDAARPMYGHQFVRETGLQNPTVYAILGKLRRLGWIVSEREAMHEVVGRTPREFHRLTAGGRRKARAVVDGWRAKHPGGLSDVDRQAA